MHPGLLPHSVAIIAKSSPTMWQARRQEGLLFFVCVVTLSQLAVPSSATLPNSHGCATQPFSSMEYCDSTLPMETRVDSLLSHLQLKEKLLLLGANPSQDACAFRDSGVPRLGVPAYTWCVETNTGVSSACLAPGHCVTTFSGPAALAASFNKSLWFAKGEVISTELRALNNLGGTRGINYPAYLAFGIGLNGWGPNINLVRDPRFGRNSELPSEDPLLTGMYASQYVLGLQNATGDHKYVKFLASLKHFAAYSVETNRSSFNAIIDEYDLFDSYLPAYRTGLVVGKAKGVMCSYASVNGVPSCANNFLVNNLIRGQWGREDALIVSDCGALKNMVEANHYASTFPDAAAASITAGVDLNAGYVFSGGPLGSAVDNGTVHEAVVDQAVRRSLLQRFQAGLFDPLPQPPYTQYGMAQLNASAHFALNLDGAEQSLILLKNDDNCLPLPTGEKRVAVIGPHSMSRHGLLSDYYGDQVCYSAQHDRTFDCIETVYEAMVRHNGLQRTTLAPGTNISNATTESIAQAVAVARSADVVVLALGIDFSLEHEGIDRHNTSLPAVQQELARQVFTLGKPTVLVLISGGILSVEDLVPHASAVIQSFYPGPRGATALARAVFGVTNRWGKLPVTMYPSSFVEQASLFSFSMSKPPGRTYRYYTGHAVFPFGFGLSFATFKVSCSPQHSVVSWARVHPQADASTTVVCDVVNTSPRSGDEVLHLFHVPSASLSDAPRPLKQLVAFTRVFVPAHGTRQVKFVLSPFHALVRDRRGRSVVAAPEQHFLACVGSDLACVGWRPDPTHTNTAAREGILRVRWNTARSFPIVFSEEEVVDGLTRDALLHPR